MRATPPWAGRRPHERNVASLLALPPEAERLLARALALRRELGDGTGLGKVRIQQGIIAGYAGDPERGVLLLVEALDLVAGDVDLARAAVQSLVWHLLEAGHPRLARAVLAAACGLFAQGGELFQLKVQWLEAKLACEGSSSGEACRRYAATLRAYAERGLLREAASLARDLAGLRLFPFP